MIIDFHTHAFPDFLAPRAIPTLAENSGLIPYHDGTAAGLIPVSYTHLTLPTKSRV